MTIDSSQALARLKEGNERFVRGQTRSTYSAEERATVAEEPSPFAVIIGCADSRVPVEAVFDVGVGDVWVIRTAGNVLADAGLASVRFGVEQWGIPLVVVLGHEDCLAVKAAVEGEQPKWMEPITDYISEHLPERAELADGADEAELQAVVDNHVRASVAALNTFLRLLPLPDGPPPVVGGTYRTSTGEIRWLE